MGDGGGGVPGPIALPPKKKKKKKKITSLYLGQNFVGSTDEPPSPPPPPEDSWGVVLSESRSLIDVDFNWGGVQKGHLPPCPPSKKGEQFIIAIVSNVLENGYLPIRK